MLGGLTIRVLLRVVLGTEAAVLDRVVVGMAWNELSNARLCRPSRRCILVHIGGLHTHGLNTKTLLCCHQHWDLCRSDVHDGAVGTVGYGTIPTRPTRQTPDANGHWRGCTRCRARADSSAINLCHVEGICATFTARYGGLVGRNLWSTNIELESWRWVTLGVLTRPFDRHSLYASHCCWQRQPTSRVVATPWRFFFHLRSNASQSMSIWALWSSGTM